MDIYIYVCFLPLAVPGPYPRSHTSPVTHVLLLHRLFNVASFATVTQSRGQMHAHRHAREAEPTAGQKSRGDGSKATASEHVLIPICAPLRHSYYKKR